MRILHNAVIHTNQPGQLPASALVIDRGRVLAVGGAELLEQFGSRASREDMAGRVILPGLTDAHVHLQYYSLGLQKVDVETSTREECLRRVADRAQSLSPGTWILGHGWQQNDWGGEFGTAAELDGAAPNHPVYLTAKSLHAGWANTAALRLAGITANTLDPADGRILRDEAGNPTGVLLETAMELVQKALPPVSTNMVVDAIRAAQPVLWRMGLTGVHDFDRRDCFMALQILHQNGELGLRVTKTIPVELLPEAAAIGLRTGFGDDILRIGMVKVFMDGALGPRTAAMFQPYLNEPGNRGILNMDGEQLFEYARRAADGGLGMTVHAIGDLAVHEVLNAYQQLRDYETQNNLPHLRHRVEHVQVIHPQDVARLAAMNVIASMQPIHATSDMYAAEKYWGVDRARFSYAWRTQLQQGATLAFGSDAPVESPNPFLGLHAAVTRRRADGLPGPEGWFPQERLTLQEALAGFTIGAAFAAGMEDRLGQLAPGYYADLIVLGQDPFKMDGDQLHTLKPLATMLAGDWVYQA